MSAIFKDDRHFLKMAVFHVARLVDLTSALFEILMPNFMLVSPFEKYFGLTAPLLQNYPLFSIFCYFWGKYLVMFYSS